jgi:phosphatidylglycerophosphate synthase
VSGFAYAQGWMFTAGWILITSGTLDVLDGEMARTQGQAGPRGAFIDSVVDRYGESVVFAGLAAFYRDAWVLWGVLAAWAGAFLVSYTRARAESLGIACQEGLIQRPERYVILGGSSMVSAVVAHLACNPSQGHALVAAGICVLALLANATALQRARGALRRLA